MLINFAVVEPVFAKEKKESPDSIFACINEFSHPIQRIKTTARFKNKQHQVQYHNKNKNLPTASI